MDAVWRAKDIKALSNGSDCYGNSIFICDDKQVNICHSKVGQGNLGLEILGDKGTIIINSISKLTNIKILWHDAKEETIIGDVPKHIIMGQEAGF